MIKRARFPKIYLGWWINIVTSIISSFGNGFISLGASALFKPIAADLNLNRALASIATGIVVFQNGVTFGIAGWLADKFGPKWVSITGICIMGVGLVLMNFINSTWSYYLVWGVVIGGGQALGFAVAIDKMLTNWFISKRGLAQGIRFALLGIVSAIIIPLVTWQVAEQGWRITCLTWAGIMFISAPFALMFVKQKRPEYYGLLPDGASLESESDTDLDAMIGRGVDYAADFEEREFTLRQAVKTPAYWLITVSWLFAMVVGGAINTHCIPFLTDMGIGETVASGMMAMMVFFTVPARFVAGFLADRVSKDRLQYLVAGAFLMQAAGIAAFLLHQSIVTVYIFLALFGFGAGAPVPLRLTIGGRYFGRKAFASIQGTSMVFAAPAALLAPVYAGWVHDTTGSYVQAFILFVAMAALAAVLMVLMRPPKPPVQITDIRDFL